MEAVDRAAYINTADRGQLQCPPLLGELVEQEQIRIVHDGAQLSGTLTGFAAVASSVSCPATRSR